MALIELEGADVALERALEIYQLLDRSLLEGTPERDPAALFHRAETEAERGRASLLRAIERFDETRRLPFDTLLTHVADARTRLIERAHRRAVVLKIDPGGDIGQLIDSVGQARRFKQLREKYVGTGVDWVFVTGVLGFAGAGLAEALGRHDLQSVNAAFLLIQLFVVLKLLFARKFVQALLATLILGMCALVWAGQRA